MGQNGDIGLIQQLISFNASVDLPGKETEGYTALHAAVEAGQFDAVQTLLENGATQEMEAYRGEVRLGTPAELAKEKQPKILELLESYQPHLSAAEVPGEPF